MNKIKRNRRFQNSPQTQNSKGKELTNCNVRNQKHTKSMAKLLL